MHSSFRNAKGGRQSLILTYRKFSTYNLDRCMLRQRQLSEYIPKYNSTSENLCNHSQVYIYCPLNGRAVLFLIHRDVGIKIMYVCGSALWTVKFWANVFVTVFHWICVSCLGSFFSTQFNFHTPVSSPPSCPAHQARLDGLSYRNVWTITNSCNQFSKAWDNLFACPWKGIHPLLLRMLRNTGEF